MVEVVYSTDCDGILVSPTNMVTSNSDKLQGFAIEGDCKSGTGRLKLLHRYGVSHYTHPLIRQNGLWCHLYNPTPKRSPTVKRLNDACIIALWHGRLGCAGNNVMDTIRRYIVGIDKPLRKNPFHRCPFCLPNKMGKRSLKNKYKRKGNTKTQEPTSKHCSNPLHDDDTVKGESGQHFHMNFGFERCSEYKVKNETGGSTITSIDGFSSYLIIVDRVTRYVWIFLTTSKITTCQYFATSTEQI